MVGLPDNLILRVQLLHLMGGGGKSAIKDPHNLFYRTALM